MEVVSVSANGLSVEDRLSVSALVGSCFRKQDARRDLSRLSRPLRSDSGHIRSNVYRPVPIVPSCPDSKPPGRRADALALEGTLRTVVK